MFDEIGRPTPPLLLRPHTLGESTASAAPSKAPSPWHPGELSMQRRVGVAEKMQIVGARSIRDHLIEQHRLFYPRLPFVVLGTVDRLGDAWATVRAAQPGFLHSPEASRLEVALSRDLADPADVGMEDGDAIALLGIEPPTRRRNRLNGTIERETEQGFGVAVKQSFGNCPRYIIPRSVAYDPVRASYPRPAPIHLAHLDGRAAEMVRTADTFFVASYAMGEDGSHSVDVSHRGGPSGFVRIGVNGDLTIPEFPGNGFFNTLGNFLLNRKAGLAFIDPETGDLLQVSGDAEVVLGDPARSGAARSWRFEPRHILLRPEALPLRPWPDMSPTIVSKAKV